MKLYLDTETVGLNGPCKLVQYSIDRGPVRFAPLFEGWEKDRTTCSELDKIWEVLSNADAELVGYNLGFDLYHIYRVRHQQLGLPLDSHDRPVAPFAARVVDLYNHMVRKGPFAPWAFSKKTGKKVVAVRRIPRIAKQQVAQYVEALLASSLPEGVKVERSEHTVKNRTDLVTLSWRAAASLSLKAHAEHYLKQPATRIEEVWPLPPKNNKGQNAESLWLPYPENNHWVNYETLGKECEEIVAKRDPRWEKFYKYAEDDIKYLWAVEDGAGPFEPDHHDAAVEVVAYTRYHGFEVDRFALERTKVYYQTKIYEAERMLAGVNLKSSKQKLAKLRQYCPLIGNSSKAALMQYAKEDSPLGECARAMRNFGAYKQRLDQVNKVLECRTGRWHPDLRVMGTATGRAAGTAGFNAQGIAQVEENDKTVGLRAAIRTPWGGDFASFEVAIAASAWQDSQLLSDLDGKVDVHLVTAIAIHPDLVEEKWTYEAALKAYKEGNQKIKRCRTETKRVVFGILYGAGRFKVAETLGIPDEEAETVIARFFDRYKGAAVHRAREELTFCTADTETWNPASVARMATSASDMTGFERSFKFEAQVADALWRSARLPASLSESLPSGTIVRSPEKGAQTIHGAVRSAFMGAAITIQRAVSRAAINMPIQATGANLTKQLQAELWIKYHIPMLNVHDELLAAQHPNFIKHENELEGSVKKFIEAKRPLVRHIAFEAKKTEKWSDK